MSKQQEQPLKRFFVKISPEMHRKLRVMAAVDDASVEIVGGALLEAAITMREAEDAKRDKPKR